jgi:hypothetical protein
MNTEIKNEELLKNYYQPHSNELTEINNKLNLETMNTELKKEELVNNSNQPHSNELKEINNELNLDEMNTETKNEELVKNDNQPHSNELNEINNGIKNQKSKNESTVKNSTGLIPSTIQDGNWTIKVPSKKWLDDYMINGIQTGMIHMIEFSIEKVLEEFEQEIEDMWSDCDYRLNFPYQNLDNVLEYYNREYLDELDSELIYRLKRYLKEESRRLYDVRKNWSPEEKEFEEYIT